MLALTLSFQNKFSKVGNLAKKWFSFVNNINN